MRKTKVRQRRILVDATDLSDSPFGADYSRVQDKLCAQLSLTSQRRSVVRWMATNCHFGMVDAHENVKTTSANAETGLKTSPGTASCHALVPYTPFFEKVVSAAKDKQTHVITVRLQEEGTMKRSTVVWLSA